MRRLTTVGILMLALSANAATIPSPEEYFGHQVGADRTLIPYPEILGYLELVARASDRVSMEEAGSSTLGHRMPVVVLSSPANQLRLNEIREQARQIARPDTHAPEATGRLIESTPVVALVTCTIHSTEVGSTQMSVEFVYQFATTQDPEQLAWMDEVVLLLMPSINPDGQYLVVDWYEQWLGTEFEGGSMPWLYHHYVGHDNNRDFYALTQKESQVVNDLLYKRWFPQVFLDEHQMGSTGPRMFVPPQTDPLDPEVHALVFRMADIIGTNMSCRLEEADKTGVGHNMIFDSYWPGGTRNTAWWKNVTGLLTEVASARIASPIFVDPGELRGGAKGFPEYGRRSNFPSPWPGGWWRLRDIVEYELVATWAYLEAVARDRTHILRNVDRMARESIARGQQEAPFAFLVPPSQHDPVAARRLVALLLRHGVTVQRAEQSFQLGYATYPAGTIVVSAAQPYRPFLLTMLRPQRYPEVKPSADAAVILPYDVASWSLPIAMGVDVVEAEAPVRGQLTEIDDADWPRQAIALDREAAGALIPSGADSLYTAVNRLLATGHAVARALEDGAGITRGDVWIDYSDCARDELLALADELALPTRELASAPPTLRPLETRRVGLFKPWVASMDEGWTRWVLEQYEFPLVSLSNEHFRTGEFRELADVLLFPDVEPGVISKGERKPGYRGDFVPLPPPYVGGIDEWPADAGTAGGSGSEPGTEATARITGGEHIKQWVAAGGTVVALDSATEYFIQLFKLPVKNALDGVDDHEFLCPGSTLRVEVDTSHPLAWGLRAEEAVYFADSPAFQTSVPDPRFSRQVVVRYPEHRTDILISGYLEGAEKLERRAAVVEYGIGKGRVVLIGFRPQHRGQTVRTFKLLFNALY